MQNNALDNHTIEAAGHERLATPPPVQNRSSRATTTTTATSTASTSKDVDQRMASVTLPLRPQLSARHSRPLPPPVLHTRSLPRSSPGGAVRKAPPQPPPRPASTLTARSTPIVRSPSPPRTHLQSQTLVMTRASIPASAAASPPPPPPLLSSLVIESTEAAAVMTPEEMSEAEARLISLTNPRPEPERSSNHYVDAPRPKSLPQSSASTSLARQNSLLKQASSNNPHQSLPPVINSQPQSIVAASAAAASASATSTLKKPMPLPLSDGLPPLSSPVELPGNGNSSPGAESSIICQDCGKCRCAACRAPRKLPKKWLCGNSCLCSKNTVIDDLSCMCCVKGLFYHCGKDAEDFDEDAHPCSLKNGHALARFGCMAILVPFLPCLLCYPVLGGCAKATEAVYSKCTSSGCRCNVNNNTTTSAVNGSNALSSGLEQATITLKDKSQRLTSTASMLRPVLRSLPSEDSLSDDISKASTVTTFVESEKRLLD